MERECDIALPSGPTAATHMPRRDADGDGHTNITLSPDKREGAPDDMVCTILKPVLTHSVWGRHYYPSMSIRG